MEQPVAIKTMDELKSWVGKEVAVGRWITVTQEMINKFAEASGDFQWIHVDVERCKKESPFKTPIAHGNRPGSNRSDAPARPPGAAYTVDSYRRAIEYAK